jgi:FKBP-type peptidyl-prolyl cis-trans isomerase
MALCAAVALALTSSACGKDDSSPSGVFDIAALQTIDGTVGTGTTATAGRTLTVHYTLWYYNPTAAGNKGSKIESSRDRNQPFVFTLGAGSVIAGWDQGIPGMRVGGTRTLLVPSSLAYGSRGQGSIPPNAALVFDIELLNVQ